jgi:hypothetical protein
MRSFNKIVVITLLAFMVAILIQCNSKTGNSTPISPSRDIFPDSDVMKGKALAANYCQSCHKLPDPSLLDKETWRNGVLPEMGLYLGIQSPAVAGSLRPPGSDLDYLPDSALMDSVKWKQIAAYFITKAPDHLPIPTKALPIHQLPFFKIEPAPAEWFSAPAITSYVKIDTSVSPHRLIVNDGMTNRFIILNDKSQTLK